MPSVSVCDKGGQWFSGSLDIVVGCGELLHGCIHALGFVAYPVLACGQFAWVQHHGAMAPALQLSRQQFDALVLGLPWQRLEELSVISRT